MTTDNVENTDQTKSISKIDQIIFITMMILGLVGVAITDASPANAHGYWVFTLIAYGCIVIFSGRKLAATHGKNFGRFVVDQIIHWGGALLAILCVYTMVHTGTINYEEAGAVMLLILALATFLAGSHAGWRFYILGALLALSTIIMSYIEEFIWVILIVALILVIGTYFFARAKSK